MRRTRTFVMAAVVLCAAVAPAAVAGAAQPAKADRADLARAEHARIVAYWTPERMRAAIPRDFVRQSDGSFQQAQPTKGGGANKGKPGGGGGSGDTGGTTCSGDVPTTSGSSWDCTGDVKRLTGKVLFTMGGKQYVCSGSVAEDGDGVADGNGNALVLTAAHCVWDQAAGEFATNWMFFPDFDSTPTYTCDASTFGCWTATSLVAHTGFTTQTQFNATAITHDFAFAVVGRGGKDKSELDVRMGGEYQVGMSTSKLGSVTAFGYPQAPPYDGSDLVYCDGTPFADSGLSNLTWGLGCTMTGGASGGPWLSGVQWDGAGGTLVSLNSYKYQGRRGSAYMYGPQFNDDTAEVWTVAKGVAAGTGSGSTDTVQVG
jgi:hypothetical protein